MFKKSVVLAIVMVMLVSFSAAVLAEEPLENVEEGKALKNNSGVVISVDENDKVKQIEFLDAGNENARDKKQGNPERPTNPILVAGN